MRITIPEYFMGRPVNGAIERVFANQNSNTEQPTSTTPTPANILHPEKYIILEGRTHGNYTYQDLLVSMEKSHLGETWDNCYEALQQEEQFMLPIREFVDFINLLKSGRAFDGNGRTINTKTLTQILNEIIEVRNPWRSEMLGNKFKDVNGVLHIEHNHRFVNGQLQSLNTEPLEQYLMQDKTPGISLDHWLSNANSQGLPIPNTNNGDLYYWHPRDNSVARFGSDSGWAGLNCVGGPGDSCPALGVRGARKK